MNNKTPPSNQRIIDCLNSDFGIKVSTLSCLPWGADTNSSVYKAQAYDQSSYFVKLKRGHGHEISAELTKFLHDAGITQVIPPINTIQGRPTQHIDDFTIIVYPFVEGQNGFTHNLTDAQWITLGKALRQIHEIDIPLLLKKQIRREGYSSKWRETVRSLYIRIEDQLVCDEIASKLLKFMKENKVVINQLVDRAEQLSQTILKQSPKLVLCHSDIHGGNVLIDNNDTLYVVDWDEPIMAPIERDLMFIGAGVANVWNNPLEVELFYQGYGKADINMDLLAYYRCERILEDIAIYGQNLLLTTTGGENRSIMYQHFMDMFSPNGVVDIAFKTGKF